MTNPLRVFAGDLVAFHRWLMEIPNPEHLQYDPNCVVCRKQRDGTARAWDFHGDWRGTVARAWLTKIYRRFKCG